MTQQMQVDEGSQVGEYVISVATPSRITVRRWPLFGMISLILGIVGLACGILAIWPSVGGGTLGAIFNRAHSWWYVFFGWAAIAFVFGVQYLGESYSFDSQLARVVIRRWGLSRQIDVSCLRAVEVAARHMGSEEILVLSLLPISGAAIDLFFAHAKKAGLQLTSLAQRCADTIRLPLERSGVAQHSGESVQAAMSDLPAADAGDGQDIRINCARCGGKGVAAVCYNEEQSFEGVIRQTTTWVKCMACGQRLLSKVPIEELRGKSPEQLQQFLHSYVSFIARSMAVVALVLSIIPVVGLCMSLVALASNWKHRSWAKIVSWIAMVISVVSSGWLGIALLLEK